MLMSMTGYGSASGSCGSHDVLVELKSVNNRYLDCSVRMPRQYIFAEEQIKSLVQKHISRGKQMFTSIFLQITRPLRLLKLISLSLTPT